uniref:Uncharacterized protein n=1 Tax=Oryza nivara TaxID=4536 RepID=A0A0E0IQC1_ORYNI
MSTWIADEDAALLLSESIRLNPCGCTTGATGTGYMSVTSPANPSNAGAPATSSGSVSATPLCSVSCRRSSVLGHLLLEDYMTGHDNDEFDDESISNTETTKLYGHEEVVTWFARPFKGKNIVESDHSPIPSLLDPIVTLFA